eukprot:GILJ01007785.1.p1 GENE.GILJ01007785.1~~GILJ01007785.1.p1  ORF type:complete len:320 (-),score=30.72 GILJ01007785.1:121-987(-)
MKRTIYRRAASLSQDATANDFELPFLRDRIVLPAKATDHMLSFLVGMQLAKCCRVSRHWNKVLSDDATWRRLFEKLPQISLFEQCPKQVSWKQTYRDIWCCRKRLARTWRSFTHVYVESNAGAIDDELNDFKKNLVPVVASLESRFKAIMLSFDGTVVPTGLFELPLDYETFIKGADGIEFIVKQKNQTGDSISLYGLQAVLMSYKLDSTQTDALYAMNSERHPFWIEIGSRGPFEKYLMNCNIRDLGFGTVAASAPGSGSRKFLAHSFAAFLDKLDAILQPPDCRRR